MSNYQTVTIEGNVTHPPTFKTTKTGKNVCTFSLAVHHHSSDDSQEKVSYFDIETWDKLAEMCSKNIHKGRHILAFGTLRQDRWEGEDGKKQSKIKVVGKEIRFLESFPKPAVGTEPEPGGTELKAV